MDIRTVEKLISDGKMMEVGSRDLITMIFLLFGTLKENQYASVNYFTDMIASFGYTLNYADRKVIHSKLNYFAPEYLERIKLNDYLEDTRMEICKGAEGDICHEGASRTRSLFRLNEKGKKRLAEIERRFVVMVAVQKNRTYSMSSA